MRYGVFLVFIAFKCSVFTLQARMVCVRFSFPTVLLRQHLLESCQPRLKSPSRPLFGNQFPSPRRDANRGQRVPCYYYYCNYYHFDYYHHHHCHHHDHCSVASRRQKPLPLFRHASSPARSLLGPFAPWSGQHLSACQTPYFYSYLHLLQVFLLILVFVCVCFLICFSLD